MRDELTQHSVGITERDEAFVIESCPGMLELDVMLDEALDPETD